jgi:hypothetical protein
MTELEMFVLLTAYTDSPFNRIRNICIPNVILNYGKHECDIIILSPARWATEVEIKCSVTDLKRDADKKHQHINEQIKYLWFALSSEITNAAYQYIPDRAGILQGYWHKYNDYKGINRFRIIRKPEKNKHAVKWTQQEYDRFLFKAYERMYKYLFDLNDYRKDLKAIQMEVKHESINS